MARKRLTLDAIERMQTKAVQFLRDVANDSDKADEFEEMTPEEYAEHKGIEIAATNPHQKTSELREKSMLTKPEMEERIAELEEENEDLQSRLDSIIDIVQPAEDELDCSNDEEEEEQSDEDFE